MPKEPPIQVTACTDPELVQLAVSGCRVLLEDNEKVRAGIVLLTSVCNADGHGNHVTAAVLARSGRMTPSECRLTVRRMRALADHLEQEYAPPGAEN